MRFHRAKLVRKHLRFYRIVYGILDPYDVLLDGNFIFAALEHKLDIRDRLMRLLQGSEIKLYVTKSALKELETIGSKGEKALEFATKFCTCIDDKPGANTTTADCILNLIQSKSSSSKKYFVASQDKDLRIALSKIPGVPTVYFNKVILVLESPSVSSLAGHSQIERKKISAKSAELAVIEQIGHSSSHSSSSSTTASNAHLPAADSVRLRGSSGAVGSSPQPAVRRKHKAKSSNPLASMKAQQGSKTSQKKKSESFRRR